MQTAALDGLYKDTCLIIDKTQQTAYHVVNETLIKRNWLLGMRIQHEVLKKQRAEYGKQVIQKLSAQLVTRYGNSFTKRNLYHFIDFYRLFPDIFHAGSGKFSNEQIVNSLRSQSIEAQLEILHSLRAKSPIRLSWTHYRIIL